jgi:hypothetical protein
MPKLARTIFFPPAESLAGARLDALHEETRRSRRDLVLDYHALQLSHSPELFAIDGQVYEHVKGLYAPRRLRFINVQSLTLPKLYQQLKTLPLDHGARSLRGALHWRTTEGRFYYMVFNGSTEADLLLAAQHWVSEERGGPKQSVDYARDWSPAPTFVSRLWAETKAIHRRYGGDPVTIELENCVHPQRLFVGGLHNQSKTRPAVDVVLNISEDASRWVKNKKLYPADRWRTRGEGRAGMTTSKLTEEANWVIERLRANQKVLVHCSAGFNRSVAICCAVLIVLEGLSAEAALDRVREHHPWARPDSHHWLALRWLAHTPLK